MRIDFNTKTGKRLGSVSLLQFSTSWAALITAVMALYAPAETIGTWLATFSVPLKLPLPPVEDTPSWFPFGLPGWILDAFVSPWILVIKAIAATVAIALAWMRGVNGVVLWVAWGIHEHVLLRTRLITNKVREEIRTFPNRSRDTYENEIKEAKRDARILDTACESRIVTNERTQTMNWIDRRRQLALCKIPNNEDTRRDHLKACLAALRDQAHKISGKSVEFYVSPVQPSIIYVLNKIKQTCDLGDTLSIHSHSNTGPQTVWNAATGILSSTEDERQSQIRMFAAPLSAYVMYDPSSPETPDGHEELSTFFEAVCVLIKEQQDILVVDDGNRVPIRKSRILYYNNSTAEECWAKSASVTQPIFSKAIIDKYEEYLAYLQGGAPQNEQPLKPGDAIVTWPPLTRFYEGKAVGSAHFNRKNVFEKNLTSMSRILLFTEKRDIGRSDDLNKFEDLLIESLIHTMLDLRITYEKRWLPTHVFDHWKFLSPYRSMFRDLISAA